MQSETNYDEARIPPYQLPDPFLCGNGKVVDDIETWRQVRRPEILRLFEREMYGIMPNRLETTWMEAPRIEANVMGGVATRKQVSIHFAKDLPKMDVLIYQPSRGVKPYPLFLGLNFMGNHAIQADPGIWISESWFPEFGPGVENHHATSAGRGLAAGWWPVERMLERGYAFATVYYGDIDPDYDDGFKNGVHALFSRTGPDAWGSIGAWAWGLNRVMDYIETDPDLDANRVAVMGTSRLGKAALWAGATDERFALVISNVSGCAGAALSRRAFGETVSAINKAFPHWFCENFHQYNQCEADLPFDQHMLLALVAPRPLYVASAEEDLWSDPHGEFLSAYHASPVYRLFGTEGLAASEMPALNQPVTSRIGYHIRTGKHGVTPYDWEQFINFADKHLRKV